MSGTIRERTITIKGVGQASAKPDSIVISMSMVTLDIEYEKAMNLAASRISELSEAIQSVGFEKDELKTTNFNMDTRYESVKNRDGTYRRVFKGFAVSHDLKVTMDMDTKRLSKVLFVIAGNSAHPEMNISFTIKDPTAIKDELLKSVAENARRRAEVLCSATGATLGELLAIDYNWGEVDIYSRTSYCLAEETLAMPARSIDFEPDDISLSDTATFVWELR